MRRETTSLAVLLPASILLVLGKGGWASAAEERRYALIIGQNTVPAGAGDRAPQPLKFADDDALSFYDLRRELGDEAILLVSPDPETRRRFQQSAEAATPPTLAALDRAVAALAEKMAADKQAHRASVFSFFYSGHGVRGADGQVGLALSDGVLWQQLLYERILDRAPADLVHVFIDACHAGELVRLRDGDAKTVTLSPEDVATYVAQATPARYPHVGLAVANSRSGDAHEWDQYQSGVFTHEVISALRGGADINGDRRIEYSELDAFLASANREVEDPRARLQALIRPPETQPRAPLSDLSRQPALSRLVKIPAAPDSFSIEDSSGNRLADGRPEIGFSMSMALPPNRRLFVRRGDQEADLVLRPGSDLDFAGLTFRSRPARTRGALESALRGGLFLAQYGPSYYRGYVDRKETTSVPLAATLDSFPDAPRPVTSPPGHRSAIRPILAGAGAALVASSAVFGGLAWSAWRDNQGAVERDSAEASARFRLDSALSAGFLVSGLACAAAAWLFKNDAR